MISLVAIGGGKITARETEAIDRHALLLTEAERPKVTFIGAASSDDAEYAQNFADYYKSLGAEVTTLALTRSPSEDEIDEAIFGADMLYGGGGSTAKLIEYLQTAGVADRIDQVAQDSRILVVAGLSAGANMQAAYCSTDHGVEDGPLDIIPGLGYMPRTLISPHHITEGEARWKFLKESLPLADAPHIKAIAIDDWAAYVVPHSYQGSYGIASRPDSHVYSVTPLVDRENAIAPIIERALAADGSIVR